MPKNAKERTRKPPTAVRSVADSIHDLAGTVLFEAGFTNQLMDREELVEILRMLEDCREEGRALYPEILVTTSHEDCLKPIHPIQIIWCGESNDRPGRFKRALKRCAPIADEPWVVVLEVSDSKLRYGVAATSVRADSESLHEAVFDFTMSDNHMPFMFLRRHGNRAVLLRTTKGERVVSLTLSDELLKATDDIAAFSRLVTSQSSDPSSPNSMRLIQRLLTKACREGHGLIACVMDGAAEDVHKAKALFQDGAWLAPAISLLPNESDEENVAATLEDDSALRARIELAQAMLEMDLMTMFSTRSELLGYNIHIPASQSSGVAGGARTRAFNSLKDQPFLKAVFMCSQDGQTTFLDLANAQK